MIGLGIFGALGFLLFTRPRVRPTPRGIRVRNVIGSYDLPWEVVRAVRFDRGAPWASLELHDDDLLPMVALQAADKEFARSTAVRRAAPRCYARRDLAQPRRHATGQSRATPLTSRSPIWAADGRAGARVAGRPGCPCVPCTSHVSDGLESGAPAPTRVAATVAGSGHRFRACPGAGCASCDRARPVERALACAGAFCFPGRLPAPGAATEVGDVSRRNETRGGPISVEPRVNEQIRAREVRLVGPEGEQVGIVPLERALQLAADVDLDLVEVAPMARPPVCKLMDFGKFKYESALKAREARRNQQQTVIKEMKLRPKIDPHDYETKKGHVVRFLKAGDKVKVTIMFRGREQSRPELGFRLLRRLEPRRSRSWASSRPRRSRTAAT